MTKLIDMAMPIATKLGFGGCLGAMSGYAFKQGIKKAAVACGLAFMGLQYAAYKGLITINWK